MSEEGEVIGTILNVQNNLVNAMENIQTNLANTMVNVQNNIENQLVDQTNMSIVSTWGRGFPGLGTSAEAFVEELNKIDSMFKVDYEASGEFDGGAFAAFDLVSEGKKDAYISADYYWIDKDPAYSFFTALPGGMKTTEHIAWILWGDGQTLWDEVAAQYNIKPFIIGSTGLQAGYYSNIKFDTLEDFKGAKIRQPGLGARTIEELGATAISMRGGELYEALKSGEIDATEWVGPWNDYLMKFFEVAKYYYVVNTAEMGSVITLGINLEFWNKLSKEKRTIIENMSKAEALNMWTKYWFNNSKYLLEIKKEAPPDFEIIKFPPDVQAGLFKAGYEVIEEISNTNELTKKIYDSWKKQLNIYKYWSEIDLYAFTERNKQFK